MWADTSQPAKASIGDLRSVKQKLVEETEVLQML